MMKQITSIIIASLLLFSCWVEKPQEPVKIPQEVKVNTSITETEDTTQVDDLPQEDIVDETQSGSSDIIVEDPMLVEDPEIIKRTEFPEFSMLDFPYHNTAEDCYIAVEGKVYDITWYFGTNVNWDETLTSYCGQEWSSPIPADQLEKFYIWTLSTQTPVNIDNLPTNTAVTPQVTSTIIEDDTDDDEGQ